MALPTGPEVRTLVLDKMRKALEAKRITIGQWIAAQAVAFPETTPRILGDSLKVQKSRKRGYLTAIVYMAPATESLVYGGQNACPHASAGCAAACLGHRSARLRMVSGAQAKAWKTLLWIYRPDVFKSLLGREVYNHRNKAFHAGLVPAIRLNGSTDYAWERKFPKLFKDNPSTVFYDYSKSWKRVLSKRLPGNYSLTFSRSETNETEAIEVLKAGGNVAIVFTDLDKAMRDGWNGFRVINGDETDARPTDDTGVVVGLSPKAKVTDDTGFFVHN